MFKINRLTKLIVILLGLFLFNPSTIFANKIINCKSCSSEKNSSENKRLEQISKIWDRNFIPQKIKKDLLGIGINSTFYWMACRNKPMKKIDILQHKTALEDGWDYFTFIVCVDDLFDEQHDLNINQVKFLLRRLKDDLNYLGLINSDKTVMISLKGEEKVKPKPSSGLNELVFTRKYENNPKLRKSFLKLWEKFENKFNNNSNIVFNLYNEPNYRAFGEPQGAKLWFDEAEKIINSIRKINPQRTIMVEGTNKSLFRRYGLDIMKKVNFNNIIYGYHYYPYSGSRFKKKTSKINRSKLETMNAKNSILLVNHSIKNEMPIILSEVAAHSPFKDKKGKVIKGMSENDYMFFIKSIKKNFFSRGIGLTWWGLYSKQSTPYKRLPSTKENNKNREDISFKNYVNILVKN